MSLIKLIEGASDVLYRNYDESSAFISKFSEDYPIGRMQDYLGEHTETDRDKNKNVDDLTFSSVWEKKSKQMAYLNLDISNDLQKSLQTFSELECVDCKSNTPITFYKILCYILNSEAEVKTFRLFFDILDDCTNINKCYRNVSSGGTAEGNAIEGADYDFMTVLEQITVDESIRQRKRPMIIFDMENSYPGFAHLRIEEGQYSNELFHYWGEETTYGRLVSNTRFKEYFRQRYRDSDIKFHGPCISTTDDTVDHMFCLKSQSWPSITKQWINRTSLQTWPSAEVVSAVIKEDVLFAPIGSKFGGSSNCTYEWRISFSIAEKRLIRSFNHTQLLCYKFYKYLRKDLIKQTLADEFLCSYFFKTTLFWMCEQDPPYLWGPENILQCFREFQRMLLYWIKYEFCPHYFIPDNNLFQGLLADKSLKIKLEGILSNLLSMFLSSSHYAQTFLKFSLLKYYFDESTVTPNQQNIKSILRSYRYLKATIRVCTLTQISGITRKCVFRLQGKKQTYFVKGVYLSALCMACQTYAQLCSIEANNNKIIYTKRKQVLSHLLIGTKSDAANGWCLLSSYFYKTHQCKPAIKISELILEKTSIDKIVPMENFDYTLQYIDKNVRRWDTRLSLLTLMKTFCLDFIYLLLEPAWRFDEFYSEIGYGMVDIPPIPYVHFVRFLSFNRLGNIVQRDNAIKDMVSYVRSGRYIENPRARVNAYGVLAKAYLAIGDKEAAMYWIKHVHRLHNDRYGPK